MNLTDQTVNGTNEIYLTDSLNASLLEVKVGLGETSVIPSETDLIVYVDTSSSSSPTENRKQYLFNLNDTLKYLNGTSDEFSVKLAIENNDAFMKATVKRMIGSSEEGNIVLETPIVEELEGYPLTLFEGENYIYTNYENAVIEIIYPKDTAFNRMFLNNASYVDHKLRNDGEFCLDDIYFKDAFTKTEDKLNLEVNHASIDCLSSNNNKFSLDSEGNLIVGSIMTTKTQTNVAGEVILEEEAPTITIDNLDALNDGGIYEFFAIGYTNSTTSTDMIIKINDQTSGYHHSYINASGALTANGELTSRANYKHNATNIHEYLQTNGPHNTFPVIVEGRMYISENSSGQKKVNYTLRFYRCVSGGQSVLIAGGVFSQNFDNINSISLSLSNSAINFTKGSRLTVFTPLKGAKGNQGDVGPSNILTIGTVVAGNEASATISGESPNQVLNLVLPRGEKGDAGGTMTTTDVQNMIEERLGIIYPVGSIYMSVNNVDPSTLFGGTWEQIKDTFLLCAGDVYAAGTTGGEATHTLTIDEIPSHRHNISNPNVNGIYPQPNNLPSNSGTPNTYGGNEMSTRTQGGGQAHNNMPPYLATYVWKRIS